MANPNDNLRKLYENGLKHYSLPDFDTFSKDMKDEAKRRRFYNNMQAAYSLPDFDTFSKDIGAVAAPAPAQQSTPQAQTKPQTASTVQPVTDNTAATATVQPQQQTTTPQTQTAQQPQQPQQPAWQPTAMQRKAFEMQMEQANARLQNMGEQARRVAERFTPQGREKAKNAKFMAQLAGAPTTPSFTGFNSGLDDANSPIPAGVKYIDGKPVTEWQMPDGSLTTNIGAAYVAEDEARKARLAHSFDNRMKSNGLNPSNEGDRQRQALIDGIHSGIDIDPTQREQVVDVMRQYDLDPKNMQHVAWVVKGDERNILQHRLALAENKLQGLMSQRTVNMDKQSGYNKDEGFWDNFVRIVGGSANSANQNMHPTPKPMQEKTQLDKDIETATAEVVKLSSDLRHYDENTEASQKGFLGKTLQGLWNGITDPNSWTMGVLESSANKTIRDVRDGANPNAQLAQSLLLSAATSEDMMANAPDPGAWYGGGRFIGEMLGDPITYISAGIGNFARGAAIEAVGKMTTKKVGTELTERLLQNSLKARLAGAAFGTGANLATFEGLRDMKQQWIDGGWVDDGYTDNQGVFHPGEFHEGVSLWHSAKASGRGFGLGAAMGLFGAGFGNVADKAVKGTSNVFGKAAIRGAQYPSSAVIEGTIFATPEIYEFQTMDDAKFDYLYADKFGYADETDPVKLEKARDAARNSVSIDAWTGSEAQIFGMKLAGKPMDIVKHPKNAIGNVAKTLGELKNSRLSFKETLSNMLDRSPFDVTLTDEERDELRKAGYGELADLFVKEQSTTTQSDDVEVINNHPEFDGYSQMEKLMYDKSVSEAARAKAYFILTGKMLPTSKITGWTTEQDGDYTTVKSLSADGGVVTSRRFKSAAAVKSEEAKIKRQVELNTVDLGEQYAQQEALRTFGREVYASVGSKYHLIKEGVENIFEKYLSGEELKDTELKIAKDVEAAVLDRAKSSTLDPHAIREKIEQETGLNIDRILKKPEADRTEQESTALNLYIEHLYSEGARMRRANDLWREQTEEARQEYVNDRKRAWRMETEGRLLEGEKPAGPGLNADGTPMKPVGRATMKFKNRQVEVLNGRVTMMEDGTMVDNNNSDTTIVIRDITTGKVEMVSPEDILTYEDYPAEAAPEAAAPEEEAAPTEQPKYGAGQIIIGNSDGSETKGWLTGSVVTEENYDELGLSPEDIGKYEYYVEGDLQHLHYATEEELGHIVKDFKPEAKQEAAPTEEEAAAPTEGEAANSNEYQQGYTGGMQDVENMSDEQLNERVQSLSTEAERLTEAGKGYMAALQYEQQRRAQEAAAKAPTEEPASIEPYNRGYGEATGDWGQKLTDEELDGQIARHQAKGENLTPFERGTLDGLLKEKERRTSLSNTENSQNITGNVNFGTENAPNITENVNLGTETAPSSSQSVENEQQPAEEQTPLQRVPTDAAGKRQWTAVDSDTAWDGLVEKFSASSNGDAALGKQKAKGYADNMVDIKTKALQKAERAKTKPTEDEDEWERSENERLANIAKAQQELQQWQKIAGVEQSRQDAIRREQEAEAQRRAAERAEQEREARAAKEEAERKEREALEGIPEWHRDTPENARARGARRFQGQLFVRQEPIADAVLGKEVDVKFSQKDIPHGRVAVIEASQLQPSHIQGKRNPMFFIDEAQPKNRSEVVSTLAAQQIAENIRPEEITGSATAYTGAPTVNTRGEVVQGNNRTDALRYLWENSLPEQQAAYKQYLLDNAEQLGIDAEAVNSKQQPVLVNMLDVDDAESIRLGQMTAQDTESGGVERIKPKNVAQKLGDDMRKYANMLLRSADEEASFGQLVDNNGADVLKWMNQVGAISNTQYQSAFDSKGNLTPEAKNDLQKVLYQAVFKGGTPQLEEMFDKLPAKAQRAILSTAFRDMDSPFAGKMIPEIQASIVAYNELMMDETFRSAKNMEQVLHAIEAYKLQFTLDDRFEQVKPSDNFSNFALHLAGLYKASDMSQSTIASYFNKMYDLAQGKVAATLFSDADTTQYPLAEVIKKVFNIDYKQAKNGNNDVANGRADVAVRNTGSQGGEPRGTEPPTSGEQTESGTEPTDRGAGTSDDSSASGGRGDLQPADEWSEGEEVDHKGHPFVKSEDGTTIFGNITDDMGLTAAPIKLSVGEQNEATSEGYGLVHIEANHGKDILNAGFKSVEDFVSYVAKNFDPDNIRVGKKRKNGSPTYLIQVTDAKHDNTLYIELSQDGAYWNVNSGGIFRKGYSNKKETVAKTEPQQPNNAVSSDSSLSADEQSGTSSTEPNGESSVSVSKGNTLSTEKQAENEKSSTQGAESEQPIDYQHAQSEAEFLKAMHHDYADVEGPNDVEATRKLVERLLSKTPQVEQRGNCKITSASTTNIYPSERDLFKENQFPAWVDDENKCVYEVEYHAPQYVGETGRLSVHKYEYSPEQTVQTAVEAASAEVNTEPTQAQIEAGNYKKGHVQVSGFDITIENPAGSVRKGVDAGGKQWETTMHNTYGYFKGTEGVDGDHIDVFLHTNMDEWDGKKAFVVDQTNSDGTFDEHKVMLGFNDKDAAMEAYLANYDANWAMTHPGLRISEVSMDEFKKWVDSSHRKTKPFADYANVDKVVTAATEQPTETKAEGYTIEARKDTRDNSDLYAVKFEERVSREEFKGQKAIAKEHGGYWSNFGKKGFLFKTREDAQAFADAIMGKSEDDVADQAPLSMADMGEKPEVVEKPTSLPKEEQPTVKKVDIEGVFNDLNKKGHTKLSDHATPVEEKKPEAPKPQPQAEAPKPKKRKWISDEDAEEFDKLRNNLRSHLGEDSDIVKEDEAGYGKQQPKEMDAEVLRMGTRMTYLMMKGGLRSFADYAEAMVDELGDAIRPHLKPLYAATQNMEEVMDLGWDEEMDDRKTVKAFDVYNFDKQGPKDIIGTAQQVVDENASQEQTDKLVETLKAERNEQRRKEADKTSADTEAVVNQAETTASKVESKLENATTEEDAERLNQSIDKELESINKQLALLGYYEADEVEKDYNEFYGYMRNAERKATQDAHLLATKLAKDLGLTIDANDKVKKDKRYGFGSSIAHSNIAPAGGEVTVTLPLGNGKELRMVLDMKPNVKWLANGRADRPADDLVFNGGYFRAENPEGKGDNRYLTGNQEIASDVTYDTLLADVRRAVRHLLPEEEVKPATALKPNPGEDLVKMAERVAKENETHNGFKRGDYVMWDRYGNGKWEKQQIIDFDKDGSPILNSFGTNWITEKADWSRIKKVEMETQPIGDLFGGLFADTEEEAPAPAKVEPKAETKPEPKPTAPKEAAPEPKAEEKVPQPLKQWRELKKKHPDAIVLVRVGDFADTFDDDAMDLNNILGLTVTTRKFPAQCKLAGFPYTKMDEYIPKLVKSGKRVAICETTDEPKTTKVNRTQNNNSNEKTNVQPRTETTGRGGQQPRPNEQVGKSAEHENERTDNRGVVGRSGEHSVSNTERGTGVPGLHQSERGVTEPKNTHNNHAERGVDYAPKGETARINANIAAIELAKKLLESGAKATPKDMAILRKYSGWGGLGAAFREGNSWSRNPINEQLRKVLSQEEYDAAVMSRNSAYYTPAPVIDAMWDIARALGFKGGNIVEGSAGIGNILGLMPTDMSERSNIHAVEIDKMTGGILSLLYPDAKVDIQGFEQTRIGNGTVDLAITNVPFVTGLHVMDESGDSDLSKKFRDIHDFCIAKNVRKLREGGIGIFITSSGTLDKSQKLRNWLVGEHEGNADVVGAFRMNNQTFGGTAATSDIIVVRKRVNGQRSANAIDVSTVSPARTAAFEDGNKTKDLPMLINRYFIEHPENMGGEMFFGFEQGDTYRPTSMGLFPTRGVDQAERMAAWVKSLADKDWKAEQGRMAADQTSHINEALGAGVKEGSMVLDSEGNICVARSGQAVPLGINKNKIKGHTKQECFKDYTAIKDALAEVLKYQTEHEDDKGLQPLIKKLNDAYDSFVKKYGNLNKNTNLAWMRNDVDFSSIVALETYSERGDKDGNKIKEYGKTDIFSRRVVDKETEPAPTNVKDGIIASLYKFGRIDSDYLAEQLGKSKEELKKEMVESGLGFENPTTGQMEVSYEYLSGNVREKLRQAKEAEQNTPGAYTANIKALEAVVPMNIPAHLIEFTLGSSWIDPKLYERFIKERTDLDVKLTSAGGTWHMSTPYFTDTSKNTELGVRSDKLGILIPGHKIIEAAITNKSIVVSKTYKMPDGSTETERDPSATNACMSKVDEIRQDFKDWAREQMQSDPDMSMRMEEVYNEQFNNSVPKQIPDDFVPEHFGGAATVVGGKPFKLRPHQAKAVIRATTQPVLLAHEVGTGKTYTLITTAMEMRRLGTARKPMIVVQNATVGQFVASAKALYPNAKVLTLEDADRNAEGRRAFYAKIKFNDWDMIVVPQSVFERIPDSIERQTQFIQDKIEEKMLVLEQMKDADPEGNSVIVRQAEREISRLEEEMAQLANGGVPEKKKEKDAKKAAVRRQNAEVKAREMLDRETDDVEDFDSMGIDAILVDEAHEYKHLGFATAMQRGVKGVDPSYSKKSQGVFLKAQSVLEKTGGKNVVFATGTPISNTAAEIWTFMRYLMPADQMKEYGIYYFDDFVRNFGNIQQMLEFSTDGKYKENNRFAGYVNLPELVRIWSTVADTVLTREAGGVSDKIPQLKNGKATDIFLPQTRALRSIMKYVKEQLAAYEKMSGKEKKANSHIPLVMYGIAKAAAVDARLVQADAEDDPNSKTNACVRHLLASLEETKDYKGAYAVFADNYQNKATGFNLFEDIRGKLIDKGIPAEQIVIMKSGMSVKKKLEIFDKVNAGEVRVIMGSTFTLGTGVNIQERLHKAYHLDAPNRPMDYTQRNGRLLRQGNLHNQWGKPVEIVRFGVEDSLDVTAYQRLKTKGAIADSIMNGKQLMSNSMENRSMEEDQDLFGDMTAQLSGSEYAMLKNQVEKEVRKLRAKQKAWEADQTYIHNRKRQIAGQNKDAEKRMAENKGYLEKVEKAEVGNITVGKQSFANVEAMEDFFSEQNKKKNELQEQIRTGYSGKTATMDVTINVGGFDFKVHTEIAQEMKQGQGTLFASAPAKMTYSCEELGIDKMPVEGNRIKNAVTDIMENVVTGKDFRERIENAERFIERNNEELHSMEARDGKPFQFTKELEQAESKLDEYDELMKKELAEKEAKYADMDKEVQAATGVEYSDEDSEEETTNESETEYVSEKNANFVHSYETEEGHSINYTSEHPEGYGGLFDFDFTGENDANLKDGVRSGSNEVQRQTSPLQTGRDSRLNPETRPSNASGEFCGVERVFKESGAFNFTSGEKIESADDVAFIFSALEDAGKEHAFVVLVKDGKPTVVELGMGTFNATMVDTPTAALAYSRINPDEVYFVHNHPSGNLKCSEQDRAMLRKMQDMADKNVPVHGVIINLKSGKYGTFDTDGGQDVGQKRIPEKASPLTVHTLDKQIFAKDFDPMEQPMVRTSEDVASFLNSQRMGDRAKVSFLIISQAGRIVGNIHTPFKNIKGDVDMKARYITDRVIQFGGQRAILYGDFEMTEAQGRDFNNLKAAMERKAGIGLLDVVNVDGNFTRSANDEGLLREPGSSYGGADVPDLRFRPVEDEKVLQEFADGKTVKAYRTVQLIDGDFYSPMATKVGGKTTPHIRLGVPEQAEEHPEIIKGTKIGKDGIEQGYVVIDKGLGKGSLQVAYNPYIHASRTVLNDQFTSAHIRPNLVVVEVEIPESELTSGYRADKAKNAVGEISWHSGTISGQLAALGRPRRVILSRYDRVVRALTHKEHAQMIADQLDGTGIPVNYNLVTPQVRAELERLGVPISEEASGSVGNEADFGKAEYITDQEIERINAKQQEMAQTSEEAKKDYAERMAKKLNTPIRIVTDVNELTHSDEDTQNALRSNKGIYDVKSGEVIVVLPNHRDVEDVAETVFHEVVAHKGLREMVGDENYDAFCDEIYDHLKDELKDEVDRDATRRFMKNPKKGLKSAIREAVDELIARLSQKGFEDFTRAERSIWKKLREKVLEAINKFLGGAMKLPKWVKLGDNELRYMAWRSHERLKGKGDYVDMARDAAKRSELGLSDNLRSRDSETGDVWNDHSLGLEERITNAAIRLSNNQSGDLTLRNDAMRAIGGNLTNLRKAMALQKRYDQATVKRVSDLARVLMQNGYLNDMTSGEMQRLLSAVKDSVGHKDVKDSVQKVMDIMVNNQLRNGENTLRQLLAIRGSKVDARGVEVQGMLDVDGQRTMEVVKRAMPLEEADIRDRMDEAMNRMSDPDQTIADQAALEYAGLNMALDYVQNIKQSKDEERTLRDLLKTAKEDKDAGRMTKDAYDQFVESTEDALRKNKIERAEAYFNLVGRLSDSLRGSIENAKAFREAEKARVNEIHHNANSDMEGRPTNEHHRDDWKDKWMNNGFMQFFFAPLGTFDQMLRVFGNKSASGEGYLWNRFMRGWVGCRNKELLGVKDKFAQLDAKAEEIFGKGTTWGKVIRMERKMPKAYVSFWDGGEMRDHELTQGNLLYIYMVDKMADGRMKLRRMGITEDNIQQIESFLDPRMKELGDWLQEEFLVNTRNEYNETHKRMFGASMAAIENYFPLKILANARIDKEEDVNQPNRPDGITTKTGSIIKRRVNNLALDITGADALSVVLDHITQMEHWNAYAEWNRDLNTLRTYKRFRNQVINMTTVYGGGRKLWQNFNDLCLMAAGEYRPPVAKLDKSMVNIAKGVTAAKVSLRVYTALKQMLSAPAYGPEVSVRSIAKSIANPYGDFKWCLNNLPIFRERWHSRISGDPRLLKSDMDWKMWRSRFMELSARVGMTPNAFVDAVTVSIGARAMYETRLKQYIREGYPEEIAEERAKQDATILFNQTQQSSEAPFLSTMQVDGSWPSVLFTVFRNSAMSYTRQEFDAIRNLKRNLTPGQRRNSVEFMTKQILRDWDINPDEATADEEERAWRAAKKRFNKQVKKDALRVATFGFILQLAWNLGPYIPYLFFGNNDDDKDKMWDDALTHAYFGSVEGLTGGDVMSAFGDMAVSGEWNSNQLTKDMPLASDINAIINKFVGGKNAEAFNDIFNLLVQSGIGINPQSLTDTAVAIMDACGDDPALSHEAALFVMRTMQVPQSQLDKLYFDEVDLSGEEASKLTPKQLAQRYATYKVKRGTPLAPWSWGDEERLDKAEKSAEDKMKARLDTQGDASVREAYADYEARHDAISKEVTAARKLLKSDYVAGAQKFAELQQHPDFELYQRFDALDKNLTKVSEMWFEAQTPEEASLIAETIKSYRSGMVEALSADTAEKQQESIMELSGLMQDFMGKYQQLHKPVQQVKR